MTTQTTTFENNISTLSNLGFNLNQSLNIIKRFNTHISFCIENEQDYEETFFYVEQDFSFDKNTTEGIMVNCMLSDKRFEEYYESKM